MSKIQELLILRQKAYAKYSNYKVASIVVTDIGEFGGVNVECGVLPLSVCAERNAIANAISNGASKLKEVHLLTSSDFGTPCGACRQVILEFATNDLVIFVYNEQGEYKKFNIQDLLPEAWHNGNLTKKEG